MGAGGSKQQIGERVKTAQKKLDERSKSDDEVYERLQKYSPETLSNMVESVEKALLSCSPFPQTTLSLAFRADSERVKTALTRCVEKVMTAPIQKEKFQWFKQYVFPSTVWFKKMENGEYLYHQMMTATNTKQKKIIRNMDAVYDHLKSHIKWKDIMNIENQSVITRQDDDAVGLLQESGLRDILDVKDSDDDDDGNEVIEELKNFIDSNLAVNILMTTAKELDSGFQREMNTILSRHGEFKPGPMKKVERATSKLENDYMDEEFPKAAKLLDIVRCSVSYNTLGQLLEGYNAFIKHVQSGISSLVLARVKNGFLDDADGGYRDIKVNVVYPSTLNPDTKMICEIQFILNQYLYEKKRVHKLYSIAREQTYFDMVTRPKEEIPRSQQLQGLNFEPILNFRDDAVALGTSAQHFYKSSINSQLGLLGVNGGIDVDHCDTFFCVALDSKQLVFKHPVDGYFTAFTHHWITINDEQYLSLQTTDNTINMFRVSDDRQFVEDESMKIVLDDADKINFCEYDQKNENILIVRNKRILEKRATNDLSTVALSIVLEREIGESYGALLNLSNDGTFCIIGGGYSGFSILISLETQEQFMLKAQHGRWSQEPCFINGDTEFVCVGGCYGQGVEIWSVDRKELVHHIGGEEITNDVHVVCSYSANGILAVGFQTNIIHFLQLYEVSTWKELYRYDMTMTPRYIYLTADSKHLAVGGSSVTADDSESDGGEKCLVFKLNV